jgi:glycine cleavage system regulatory protein
VRTSLVLTVIADDKPGIVEQLSKQVHDAGGNWEESRMARLAGKFAGLLRVSVDAEEAGTLEQNLAMLRAAGITVVAERSGETETEPFRTYGLELVGDDHPGIVSDISRVLAQHRVNIEELESEVRTAPMSGETLFYVRARLRIPSTLTIEELRTILESLAGDLMVDLTIQVGSEKFEV